MALRANRWVLTGAVTAAVLGLAGFGLGAASASGSDSSEGAATSTSVAPSTAPTGTGDSSQKGRNGTGNAAALADTLDKPDVQAFLDCLGDHGVDVPDVSAGNFSLQWEDGKLTINGTPIDLTAVGDAFEACRAQLPTPALPDLPGILGHLGPLGENGQKFADCMAGKGFEPPFAGGAVAGGLFGRGADANALIKVLESAADALRARLDAGTGTGSDVEQRLAALDAAIDALKADAANAPGTGPDPGTTPSTPDMTKLHDAIQSCRAELNGD
jgi:hypothetical protein